MECFYVNRISAGFLKQVVKAHFVTEIAQNNTSQSTICFIIFANCYFFIFSNICFGIYAHIVAFFRILKFILLFFSLQTKSCSGGWIEALGACYLLFTYSAVWSEARDTCVSYGGHLVVFTSLLENDAVINLVNSTTSKSFWTGGYYSVEVGSWLWTTGETWSFSNFKTTQTENDNMRLAITKLDYNPSRAWFARDESIARIFLCEK